MPHLLAIAEPAVLRAELDRLQVHWNGIRLHAVIDYVTPLDEHEGRGQSIRKAREAGLDARAVDAPTDGSAGASVQGKETGGTSRIVVDQARETIVGATFTGFETADFLQAATVAIVGEVPLPQLRHAVAPYPTRSEVWLRLLEKYEN